MNEVLFAGAVIIIIALCALGAVVAGAVVAQNWRAIVYIATAMVMTAGIAAACHTLRG